MTYRAKDLYKGRIAQEYDKERFGNLKGMIYDWFEKQSIRRCLKDLSKEYLILDIPCGTGRITKYLYDLYYDVCGADISEDMLNIARQKMNTMFFKTDISKMIFPDKRFDIITCVRLMGHLPYIDKRRALKEMNRVSYYVIVTFYFKDKPNWYALSGHMLNNLLEECNLEIVRKSYIFPFWSDGITYLLRRKL